MTCILFWNPAISAFTKDEFKECISNLDLDNTISWNVWEYKKLESGQRVFLMRCGSDNPKENGIVLSGYFYGEAYKGKDWSGKNRRTYYADAEIEMIIDPDCGALLTADKLSENIPSFDWTGGHSGRYLNEKDSDVLESLWAEYLDGCNDILRPGVCAFDDYNDLIMESGADFIRKLYGSSCAICGYDYNKIFPDKNSGIEIPVRYMSIRELHPELPHQCWPICSNCYEVNDEIIVERLIKKYGKSH